MILLKTFVFALRLKNGFCGRWRKTFLIQPVLFLCFFGQVFGLSASASERCTSNLSLDLLNEVATEIAKLEYRRLMDQFEAELKVGGDSFTAYEENLVMIVNAKLFTFGESTRARDNILISAGHNPFNFDVVDRVWIVAEHLLLANKKLNILLGEKISEAKQLYKSSMSKLRAKLGMNEENVTERQMLEIAHHIRSTASSDRGREILLRMGSHNSVMDPSELSEIMNWAEDLLKADKQLQEIFSPKEDKLGTPTVTKV